MNHQQITIILSHQWTTGLFIHHSSLTTHEPTPPNPPACPRCASRPGVRSRRSPTFISTEPSEDQRVEVTSWLQTPLLKLWLGLASDWEPPGNPSSYVRFTVHGDENWGCTLRYPQMVNKPWWSILVEFGHWLPTAWSTNFYFAGS